jgi:hypothetical protein
MASSVLQIPASVQSFAWKVQEKKQVFAAFWDSGLS